MVLSVKKIGNERGIFLPESILQQCAIGEEVVLTIENGSIMLLPLESRKDWDRQFKSAIAAENQVHDAVDDHFENDFDKSEWQW